MPWLTDRKWAHIRLEGQAFGDVPLTAELKLEVWDSPNSAGIVTDAVRCCKLALNNGLSGQLDGPSSYLMKSPMHQRPDDEAHQLTEAFIKKYSRKDLAARPPRPRPPSRAKGQPPRPSSHRARPAAAITAGRGARAPSARCAIDSVVVPGLTIAQVTPFAWEVAGEVNEYVARVSDELAAARPPGADHRARRSPRALVRETPPRDARPIRSSLLDGGRPDRSSGSARCCRSPRRGAGPPRCRWTSRERSRRR